MDIRDRLLAYAAALYLDAYQWSTHTEKRVMGVKKKVEEILKVAFDMPDGKQSKRLAAVQRLADELKGQIQERLTLEAVVQHLIELQGAVDGEGNLDEGKMDALHSLIEDLRKHYKDVVTKGDLNLCVPIDLRNGLRKRYPQ